MLDLVKPFSQQDRRQSATALLIARGTRRLLRRLNFSTLTEMLLLFGRRADVVALSSNGSIFIVEIKSSLADFSSDKIRLKYLFSLYHVAKWRVSCRSQPITPRSASASSAASSPRGNRWP
jgi:hypothetical protein